MFSVGDTSVDNRAFGGHLAASFGLPERPAYVRRTLRRGVLAVSELIASAASKHPSASLGYDEAYQVVVQLKNIQQQFWQGSRFVSSEPVLKGKTYIIDLRQDPHVLREDPGHTVHFYMPFSTMKAFAEQNDMNTFVDIDHSPTNGHEDLVTLRLAEAAVAAMARPHGASNLLLDSILNAVCVNVLAQYGSSNSQAKPRNFGLALWQERRAKELIDSDLDISISQLALECGVSVAHFSRAFKRSTGVTPHQWQLGRRMQRAKSLLSASTLSIAEIALECGFSSQSHFTTSFTENIGVSPGRWRSGIRR
jgi:AraC family transcriptional regulator